MYQVSVIVGSGVFESFYDTFALALAHACASARTLGDIITEWRYLDYFITIRDCGQVVLMPVMEDEHEIDGIESLGLSRP
jgi:hypothetical protein